MTNKNFNGLYLIALLIVALMAGCSDDDPTDPAPIINSVVINSSPNGIDFPWRLNLPDGNYVIGAGDSTLTQMSAGEYSLLWRNLPGWINLPSDASQTLEVGNSITFSGTYDNDLPDATNPDILMNNFKLIYEGMAPDAFAALLSDGHKTLIQPDTISDWENSDNPLLFSYFDKAWMSAIHYTMLAPGMGQDPYGNFVPHFESISISVMDKDGTWELVPVEDAHFGGMEEAYFCRYNFLMHFNKPDWTRFEVDQRFNIYVSQGEDGFWYLLGIIGLPQYGLATESTTYDQILAMYR